ncbi:Monoamine oxidase [Klebsiella michiganensis]|uniref:Monoamine oxidase n=1 Tax=Klebsiella michiganensis TaxID=1134687 RepID=A0A7H4LTP0_9ENTR|nr:Monoamine oxidase [Klebsiella michiganensis]
MAILSPRKTALALAVALFCAWQSPAFAHGSEAHMVPMDKTLQDFGADVQWDDYAQMFTLIKDGAYVKVKPGAKTVIVNGKTLELQVPVVMKDGKAWVLTLLSTTCFSPVLTRPSRWKNARIR